jgi:hypothetical protein
MRRMTLWLNLVLREEGVKEVKIYECYGMEERG